MDNIITIYPEGCKRFGHVVSSFCLPVKKRCDNTVVDGVLTDCDTLWNCNLLCTGDTPYFIPVPADGTFMIQTNFNGSGSWGSWIHIKLVDVNGDELGYDHTDFGIKWITGKSKKHNYQTIEINVANIEPDCFGFKIYTTSGDEVCTQMYKKEMCHRLVALEGLYTGFDCWNNYYGDPVGAFAGTAFKYSNKIYLKGMVKYYGGSADIEDEKIKEFTRVHPSEKIAPFMMKYLLNKVLAAEKVKADGDEYLNDGSGSFNPVGVGSMFFPIMEFYTECSNGGNAACE